jgi:hypothetical protein
MRALNGSLSQANLTETNEITFDSDVELANERPTGKESKTYEVFRDFAASASIA